MEKDLGDWQAYLVVVGGVVANGIKEFSPVELRQQ